MYNSVLLLHTTSPAPCSNDTGSIWSDSIIKIIFSKDMYTNSILYIEYILNLDHMSLLYGDCTAPYEVPLPAMSDTLSSYSSGLRSRSGIGNVGELHSEPNVFRYHLEVWPTIVCLLTAPYCWMQ